MKTLAVNPKSEIRNPKEARNPKLESRVRSALYFCFLLSALSFWASGQFAIDWRTIDGGGGTSTGGVYSVTGTNWVLQETLSLSAPSWTHSPSGTNNPVVVPATLPMKFYRLHKP